MLEVDLCEDTCHCIIHGLTDIAVGNKIHLVTLIFKTNEDSFTMGV